MGCFLPTVNLPDRRKGKGESIKEKKEVMVAIGSYPETNNWNKLNMREN